MIKAISKLVVNSLINILSRICILSSMKILLLDQLILA